MHDTEDMPADADFDEEEPSFSDPEDFEDDIDDEELLGDLLREKPQEADGIDSVVVVDNVPQVGPERLEKLKNVIHKIFSKFGKITNEFYPTVEGPEGLTKGYIFLEYGAPTQALEAVKNADGYKLDKQHTFRVNVFTDFDKYMSISDEWETPEKQPFKDFGNMRHWMEDPDCRDQYSVIYESGERTAIFNNDAKDPIVSEERARWTETYVRWSPKGTYLATFHQRGIALWGGEKFKQIQRFSHQGVSLIDFSPCERRREASTSMGLLDKKSLKITGINTGIRVRNLFNVVDCKLHWQRQGDYLCVKVDRTPKGTQAESIIAFAWEPNGSKFAVLHGESPRINASFYHVKNNGKIELINFDRAGHASSGSSGRHVLAGLRSSDVDNAYWLWTFQGRLLQKNNKDRFCQLLWRPRPATLLTQDTIKVIKKDLKKYSKIFEQKDRLSQSKASKELVDKRRSMMEDYRSYRETALQQHEDQNSIFAWGLEGALRCRLEEENLRSESLESPEFHHSLFVTSSKRALWYSDYSKLATEGGRGEGGRENRRVLPILTVVTMGTATPYHKEMRTGR
ncbi:unnamed protein product, partial [Coregonus sp. 'balchen']